MHKRARCETKVKLSKKCFEFGRAGTKLNYERGGNLQLVDGKLEQLENSTGGFNRIIMPRGRVDW